jgi:hypothetical protein
MNPSVGTRVSTTISLLDTNGHETSKVVTGTIIMIFRYAANQLCRSSTQYVIFSKGEYYLTDGYQLVTKPSFTKFGSVRQYPAHKSDPGHIPTSLFSYSKLSKKFGFSKPYSRTNRNKNFMGNGWIDVSVHSKMGGGVLVKESTVDPGWDSVRFTMVDLSKKTEFVGMVNDIIPRDKQYKIMTGSVNPGQSSGRTAYCPSKFTDPRPQPYDFYMSTSKYGNKGTANPLKFYVGIRTDPIKCSDRTFFSDPKGNKYDVDIAKQLVVPIPKEHFFKDEDGEEWIVNTGVEGNLERYIEVVEKQKDFTEKVFYPPNTSPKHTHVKSPFWWELPIDMEVKYSIGDILVGGPGNMVIGIYLINIDTRWIIKYLIAPFKSICNKSGRIVVDTTKAKFLFTSSYKHNVLDLLDGPQEWLPQNTNEIRFKTFNYDQVFREFILNDPSYKHYEQQRQICIRDHPRLNSLCFGKREDGRYCMTPVCVSGDFCDKHGGRQPNLPPCSFKGCPGKKPMSMDQWKQKTVIYKLGQTKFTRNVKFMYGKENMDVWDTKYFWKILEK